MTNGGLTITKVLFSIGRISIVCKNLYFSTPFRVRVVSFLVGNQNQVTNTSSVHTLFAD
jgi:hypothetical protein